MTEYPASHPEQHHTFVRQWNRWICVVHGCHTMKTLEHGVEYEDPTGRIDPFELDVAPEIDTDGEVQDDLVATLEENADGKQKQTTRKRT